MDAVRLMTIHQAKGLEFPIVIVADMERRINASGAGAHLHRDLGPLVRLRDEPDAKAPPSGYHLWQMLEHEEDEAELRRLLYVATTRAADHLILSSGVGDLDKPSGPWLTLLASRFDLATGDLRGPLPADEPRPQVIVTTTEPDVGKAATQGGAKLDLEALHRAIERAALDQPNRLPETAWVGKIPPDFAAPRQYSFSRLSGALARVDADNADEYDIPRASFADGRELGILVHSVLAALNFADSTSTTSTACRALVELHAERLLIDDGAIEAEALAIVERFLASPRAHALATARHALAEVEFLLAWPPDAPDGTILRGYIDRIYQDSQDRWHVLDFKTNRVGPGGLSRIVGQYEMQMLVYALAVEQALQVAPSELTLCVLRSGAEHSFAWNAQARKKAIDLVSQAMAASQAAEAEAFAQAPAYRRSGVDL
jgi:ATP-dependent helicase/nuclease subunit A